MLKDFKIQLDIDQNLQRVVRSQCWSSHCNSEVIYWNSVVIYCNSEVIYCPASVCLSPRVFLLLLCLQVSVCLCHSGWHLPLWSVSWPFSFLCYRLVVVDELWLLKVWFAFQGVYFFTFFCWPSILFFFCFPFALLRVQVAVTFNDGFPAWSEDSQTCFWGQV